MCKVLCRFCEWLNLSLVSLYLQKIMPSIVMWLVLSTTMQNLLQVYFCIPPHLPKWVLSHISFLRRSPKLLWCCSLKHRYFCIAVIGRTILPAFLIPLVKTLYLVIGTTPQDRILIAQKLTELLILTHFWIGHGCLLLTCCGSYHKLPFPTACF